MQRGLSRLSVYSTSAIDTISSSLTDTAWDPEHPYYDPKSDKDRPTWYMVNVKVRSDHMTKSVVVTAADPSRPPVH